MSWTSRHKILFSHRVIIWSSSRDSGTSPAIRVLHTARQEELKQDRARLKIATRRPHVIPDLRESVLTLPHYLFKPAPFHLPWLWQSLFGCTEVRISFTACGIVWDRMSKIKPPRMGSRRVPLAVNEILTVLERIEAIIAYQIYFVDPTHNCCIS